MGLIIAVAAGCGGDAQDQTDAGPSATVERFYQLTQANDCDKVAELFNPEKPDLASRNVAECKQFADKLVSYKILDVSMVEEGHSAEFASVDTEVTLRENGEEKTNSGTQLLIKIDGEWKLTEIR